MTHDDQIAEIFRICTDIRRAIELEEGKHYGIQSSNLDGACCRAAVEVTWVLQQAGFRATPQLATWDVNESAVHAFTRVLLRDPNHDVIVDITATQFGYKWDEVEIIDYEAMLRLGVGAWYWQLALPTTFEYLVKLSEQWCDPHRAKLPDGYKPSTHPIAISD